LNAKSAESGRVAASLAKSAEKGKTGCWKIFLDFENFLD
jgi:hypothetical protein